MTDTLLLQPITVLRFADDTPNPLWLAQLRTSVDVAHHKQALAFLLGTWRAQGTLTAEEQPVVIAVRTNGAFHVIGGEAVTDDDGDKDGAVDGAHNAARPRVHVSSDFAAAAERALKAEIDRAPDIQWSQGDDSTQVWFVDDVAAHRRLARALGADHSMMPSAAELRLVELTASATTPTIGAAFLAPPTVGT